MANFNDDQIQAIEAENASVLVSAAAGSGKTTVMVEKIRHTLQVHPEKHLANMLVITFTREAASNMRRKLQEILTEASQRGEMSASQALSEMESAQISTIHAFCSQVVRSGFHIVGVDPMFRIAETPEVDDMFASAFQDAIEDLLDTQKEPRDTACQYRVRDLLTTFSQKELLDMTHTLYEVLMGIPDGFQEMQRVITHVQDQGDDHPWVQEIRKAVEMDLYALDTCLREEKALLESPLANAKCIPVLEQDRQLLSELLRTMADMESISALQKRVQEVKDALPSITLRGVQGEEKEWYETFKEVRQTIKGSKGVLAQVLSELSGLDDPNAQRNHARMAEELQGLYTLIVEVHRQFQLKKREANVVDFSDLEQMTYRLLTDPAHPEARASMLETYTDVYVDECQDVSAIQNAIIQSLHAPDHHLFMVGDIKQSIYRFRHADPSLFLHHRDVYSTLASATERKIYFKDNYRSCRTVIQGVNQVFEHCMSRKVNELDYEEGDRLVANKEGDFDPIDVILVNKDAQTEEKEKIGALDAQCVCAARWIQKLMESSSADQAQYRYSDIAILLRSVQTDGATVAENLKKLHIPVRFDGYVNFYTLTEIAGFISLLQVIENAHQDIPLLSALLHVPFDFTEEDLALIRMQHPEAIPFYEAFEACAKRGETALEVRCKKVKEQLEDWHFQSHCMSASNFIWSLLHDTILYASYGAYPDGKLRQKNLDCIYQKAVDMESRGMYRLPDFLDMLHHAMAQGVEEEGAGNWEETDAVRILTMHKSKGLEFRAVILMNMSKSLFHRNTGNHMMLDIHPAQSERPSLGVYLPAIRRKAHTINDTYGKQAFELRYKRDEIAESTRLFYVAMTRAMERLCLIGMMDAKDEKHWREENTVSRIWRTRSMLDMLMPSVLQCTSMPETGHTSHVEPWRVSVFAPQAIPNEGEMTDVTQEGYEEILRIAGSTGDQFEPAFLPPELHVRPATTSVTSLVREAHGQESYVLLSENEDETIKNKRMQENVWVNQRLNPKPDKPTFMEDAKPTAVDAGSATHRFMRLISFERLRQGENLDQTIEEEADRLVRERIMTQDEMKRVLKKTVKVFYASPLGQRLIHAPYPKLEWKFTYQRTPGDTMLRGIIDAAFLEEDAWVLIDYKTDQDTEEGRMTERHGLQMNWYRVALEVLSHKPVKEMWIYALRAGEAYAVPRMQVTGPVSDNA